MTSREIRQSFLDFFKSKGHTIVPSSSLLPDSPNLLFTNAGMNQFVPIFLGQRKPDASKWPGAIPGRDTRAADTQKCIRAGGKHNDLEDVGLDTYHHTFFEMLGNWSFGDYFKKEAIDWAWELVVKAWGFPADRLYATVFCPYLGEPGWEAKWQTEMEQVLVLTMTSPDFIPPNPNASPFEIADQEAAMYWAKKFQTAGLDPKAHIVPGNKKDNFWMMGETGPCGPCSELHVDLTPEGNTRGSLVNKGDARCIEIWNLVFIQFNANPDGTFSSLPARHADTGMGFERVTSIIQGTKGFADFKSGKISNYETDIFHPIFDALEKLSGKRYGSTLPADTGSTGNLPVPLGDSLSATGVTSDVSAGSEPSAPSHSAGPVAQRHGQVARATQNVAPGATYSKRNLPHFEKPWAIYHVIINTIAPRKLSPAARDIVFDCILHWRESRYRLVAACVMPDHAHFIIQPGVKEEDKHGNPVFWPLSEILHSIKSYSAKEVNKLDNVRGTLWQQERYDRYVRSDADLQEKFHYVCRNPWASGLARESERWPWLWTPDIEAWRPYVPLNARTGSTGDSPVPLDDPPSGMGAISNLQTSAGFTTHAPSHSAGPVAQRHGQVARATQEQFSLDIAFRVIADHIRTLSFAIADGIQPSNEGRGYVLRRILRRAVRYGRTLGFHEPFFYKLVDVLADTMGDVFPEIRTRKQHVLETIRIEEEGFNNTLDNGIKRFNEICASLIAASRHSPGTPWAKLVSSDIEFLQRHDEQDFDQLVQEVKSQVPNWNLSIVRPISGEDAFKLYDTYGFPPDLTELMARERGLKVDVQGFNRLMEQQRKQSQAAQKKEIISLSEVFDTETEFVGYEKTEAECRVLNVSRDPKLQTFAVVDVSPLYAEMGGQVGDQGSLALEGESHSIKVLDTIKRGKTFLLKLDVNPDEPLAIGVPYSKGHLQVDLLRRNAIQRHHTVTHLLHWALHEVVSKEVSQKGSFVGPDKLTFDFNAQPLTPQQVAEIEKLVNERILENAGVSWTEVPYTEVKSRKDVMQFFGEQYGDTVRVVQIGGHAKQLDGYSMELCGGTHTRATGEIGLFRIVGESAIAAGVRRIEAVAGLEAYNRANAELQLIKTISGKVNSPVGELEKKIESLLAQQRELEKQLKTMQQKQAAEIGCSLVAKAQTFGSTRAIVENLGAGDADFLQAVADTLKGPFKGVVVLGGVSNGAVTLVATVSPELTKQFQAGKIIQTIAPIVGGKGGGRPDNARGGGKDASKLDEALAKAKSLLT
jgi:alanyl-tRNA synthetase/REP element-mobilizing transposase RayT